MWLEYTLNATKFSRASVNAFDYCSPPIIAVMWVAWFSASLDGVFLFFIFSRLIFRHYLEVLSDRKGTIVQILALGGTRMTRCDLSLSMRFLTLTCLCLSCTQKYTVVSSSACLATIFDYGTLDYQYPSNGRLRLYFMMRAYLMLLTPRGIARSGFRPLRKIPHCCLPVGDKIARKFHP